MRVVFLALLVAGLTVGCSDQTAKNAVKKVLNDPDSAQFTGLTPGKSKGDVCGFVNAKNRMGGFVGNTPFIYDDLVKSAYIVTAPEESDFRMLWLGMRSGNFKDDLSKVSSACYFMEQWSETCTIPHPQQAHEMCALMKDGAGLYKALKAKYD